MKSGKAAGVDNVPAEFLKVLDGRAMERLTELCKEIYESGVWPEDFTRVAVIPVVKKVDAVECAGYRTISLISHASKITVKILTKRLESKTEMFIGKPSLVLEEVVGHEKR